MLSIALQSTIKVPFSQKEVSKINVHMCRWILTTTCPGNLGLKLWNLEKLEGIPSTARHHAFNDPISTVMWVTCSDEGHKMLCFGTSLGYLIFWRQSKGTKTVSALA